MNDTLDAAYRETGTAVAVREEPQVGMMPLVSPDEARAQMRAYQELCAAVLTDDDYQEFTEKKRVNGEYISVTKRFKKKSAVKKLQTYFGISVDVIDAATHRDDLGEGHFGFRCKAVATSPGGRSVAALAGCATHEERFDVAQYARESDADFTRRAKKALARAYHDVLSTAETRATNRAVMNLVSPGEVTAEEISRPPRPRADPPAPSGPVVVRVSQDELLALAERAGAIAPGLDKPAALKAFGAWAATNVAPDLMERPRKALTDAETQTARMALESMTPPEQLRPQANATALETGAHSEPAGTTGIPASTIHSAGAETSPPVEGPIPASKMHPRTQGRLFALLSERGMLEKDARIEWAAKMGIGIDSFSELTEDDARLLIRKLELLPVPAPLRDPDALLKDYAAARLI